MALTRTPGITLGSDGRFFIDKRYRGVRISPTQELPLVNVRSWPGLPVRRARRQPPLARRVVSTEVRSRRQLRNPGPGQEQPPATGSFAAPNTVPRLPSKPADLSDAIVE